MIVNKADNRKYGNKSGPTLEEEPLGSLSGTLVTTTNNELRFQKFFGPMHHTSTNRSFKSPVIGEETKMAVCAKILCYDWPMIGREFKIQIQWRQKDVVAIAVKFHEYKLDIFVI